MTDNTIPLSSTIMIMVAGRTSEPTFSMTESLKRLREQCVVAIDRVETLVVVELPANEITRCIQPLDSER